MTTMRRPGSDAGPREARDARVRVGRGPWCRWTGLVLCLLVFPRAAWGQDRLAGEPADVGRLDGSVGRDVARVPGDGASLDDGAAGLDTASAPGVATTASTFAEAVDAYRGGAFERAAALFARLAEQEPDRARRAVLHGNAGTAAARAQHLGEAIWHLEAALRGLPRDPGLRRNLAMVRAGLPDAHLTAAGADARDASDFSASLRRLPLWLDEDETSLGLAIVGAAALVLLAGVRAGRLPIRAAHGAALLLVLDGAWWLAADAMRAADASRAVVIRQVEVRGEPAPDARVVVTLGPGIVVRDEDVRGAWRLVETAGGARGWVPVEDVRAAGR